MSLGWCKPHFCGAFSSEAAEGSNYRLLIWESTRTLMDKDRSERDAGCRTLLSFWEEGWLGGIHLWATGCLERATERQGWKGEQGRLLLRPAAETSDLLLLPISSSRSREASLPRVSQHPQSVTTHSHTERGAHTHTHAAETCLLQTSGVPGFCPPL